MKQVRGLGRPFQKGNAGRKAGSKNKLTLIATTLLEGEAEELVRTAIDLAKSGDKDMLKFLLARILPKNRSIRLEIPALDDALNVVDALAIVATSVSNGELTPSEGAALGTLIASCSHSIEVSDLALKISQIEADLAKGNEALAIE